MKKRTSLFFVAACLLVMGCLHHRGNTSITLSESDHYYSMKASFNKNRTRDIERYMDNRIGSRGITSFEDTRIDGEVSLEDRTKFYIKKYPGYLQIKLDKSQNSEDAYQRVRAMCEGIKDLLGK